ncbi:MAG: fumarylacetoacetate hydrolase family protein [Actinobacteria bacterium]|nr:fumarylacetoacetate hydrolase family protein [Actinomycetota bacterium]
MRLVTYTTPTGAAAVGVRGEDGILPTGEADMLALIRGGAAALERARAGAERAREAGEAIADATLLAPLPRPGRMLFCGINYHDHVREVPGRSVPSEPKIFAKIVPEATGPGAPILSPGEELGLDFEAELALVIGRTARHVPAERALEHVFGYTIVNDVSARAVQIGRGQLTFGKGFDSFCPAGPELVTADEVPDPLALQISTWVNGERKQHASTAEMIFSPAELIAFLSEHCTLEPGDLISTGTPAGVGGFREPPQYLRPGDEVAIEIDGLGRLQNPVVAA